MNKLLEGKSYHEFDSTEEVEIWARKHYADLLDIPREDELHQMISSYTGSYYKWYNKLLRNYISANGNKSREIESVDVKDDVIEIKKITDMLCKHSLPENIIAYRYTHKKDIVSLCSGKALRNGIEFSDKAFFSTTLIRKMLKGFMWENYCDCLLKLYLPQGMPGAYVSIDKEWSRLDEQEFLLPPNINFRILKIHHLTYPLKIECQAIYN